MSTEKMMLEMEIYSEFIVKVGSIYFASDGAGELFLNSNEKERSFKKSNYTNDYKFHNSKV